MSRFAKRPFFPYFVCAPLLVCACATKHTPSHTAHTSRGLTNPGARQACASSIRWIQDDYGSALAQAEKTNRPLVIDFWAKWCHTCLSMKHTILTDPSLCHLADRYVWLSLDTDLEKNAPVLARFPIHAWPTFVILSAQDEAVQAQYRGAASVAQFRAFLRSGEQGHLDQLMQRGQISLADPLYYTRQADRFALSHQSNKAAVAYAKALALAPVDWDRRPDVLTSLIAVLAKSERWSECVDLAQNNYQHTGNSASAADFAYFAMICANSLTGQTDRSHTLLRLLANRLRRLVSNNQAPLSTDDRSEAMRILREIYLLLADKQKARQLAVAQQTLLDQAVAQADNPSLAATYNWPRAEVYVFLGQGKRLIDELRESTEALPTEFDPPYRAAWVALKVGQLERALVFANTSLARAYGPRKGRIYLLIAEILKQKQDRKALEQTLREAIAFQHQLPTGQRQPAILSTMQTLLTQIHKDSPTPESHKQ